MGMKNVISVIGFFGVVCGCGQVATVEQSNKDYEAQSIKMQTAGRAKVAAVVDSALVAGVINKEDARDIVDSFEYATKEAGKWLIMPDDLEKAYKNKEPLQGFARMTEARVARAAAAVRVLKAKFAYKEDEFNKVGFYTHRNWKGREGSRTGIFATVNSRGYIYLTSWFVSGDWIFHTAASVIVKGQVYNSEEVPTYDSRNSRDNGGGKVFESVIYDYDGGIMKAIAGATADDVVKVRLSGDQYYKDFVLSAGDREAFRDCVALADLLGGRK